MKLHRRIQRDIERVFFKGKSTKSSEYVTYAVCNIILMLLIFYVLLNTFIYDWTGHLYPPGSGYRLDFVLGNLDNLIPFVPEMVIFYVYFFYSMVILTMLYFAFVEYKRGYALGWSLVIINALAAIVYIVFPVSTYWWRQDFLSNPVMNNFWASQVYGIWVDDTSFNCFPSLHAAVSTKCFLTWYQYSESKPSFATKATAAAALIITASVVLSTLFIKQHYIADEIAGIALAFTVCKLTFKRLWNSE